MNDGRYDPSQITPEVYGERRPIEGEVVALLHLKYENRGLKIDNMWSKTLLLNNIHELMITDDKEAGRGKEVNRVSALGFFEVELGGVAIVGDEVIVSGKSTGELVGFDLSHMPNHINLVIKAEKMEAPSLICVGDPVLIQKPSHPSIGR